MIKCRSSSALSGYSCRVLSSGNFTAIITLVELERDRRELLIAWMLAAYAHFGLNSADPGIQEMQELGQIAFSCTFTSVNIGGRNLPRGEEIINKIQEIPLARDQGIPVNLAEWSIGPLILFYLNLLHDNYLIPEQPVWPL